MEEYTMFSVKSFLLRPFRGRSTSAKTFAEKQKFIGTPLFNVLLMLVLMLSVSAIFRFTEWRKMNAQTQIQFNDSENLADGEKAKDKNIRQSADIFSGEVLDTSRRLRETGAFGFAVCLSILDEARSKRQIPGSIENLINAVISRGLMPPGLTVQNGEIYSNTSKIHIRYAPSPLQLEFVSVPTNPRYGPALMMRFPLTTANGKNITYFQSAKLENIMLPKAFAPDSEVIRGGWTRETWRGMEIGGDSKDFARMLSEEETKLKNKFSNENGNAAR